MTRLGLAVLCLGLCAGASGEALFSPPDNIERRILASVNGAHESIEAAVFDVTSRRLREALEGAARRGVRVRLVTDRRRVSAPAFDNTFLPTLDIRVRAGRSAGGAMHHKFAVIDGLQVMTGSYNWTLGAQHANYENLLILDDPDMAAAYQRHFETLWNRSLPALLASGSAAFHARHASRPHARRHHRFRQRLPSR
jgi:phosphatidylserine/phosphatidylglycerophosphate/cardiolipin synthase-like enzyme